MTLHKDTSERLAFVADGTSPKVEARAIVGQGPK